MRAMAEVTMVPKMKGSAPKCSKTGSQVRVNKKSQPKCARESLDWIQSSYTRRDVTAMMEAAKSRVMMWATSSPAAYRRTNARTLPGDGTRATALASEPIAHMI